MILAFHFEINSSTLEELQVCFMQSCQLFKRFVRHTFKIKFSDILVIRYNLVNCKVTKQKQLGWICDGAPVTSSQLSSHFSSSLLIVTFFRGTERTVYWSPVNVSQR